MLEDFSVRPAAPADAESIRRVQAQAPEASQWQPEQYFEHHVLVAERERSVIGFLVWRDTAPGEYEILNLAVSPAERRRGVGRALLREALERCRGAVYLEVRASNSAARAFYASSGFITLGRRTRYYSHPVEDAVVMKFHSC